MDPTQTYKNGDPPGDGVILFHRPRPCQNETKRLAHHTPTHVTQKNKTKMMYKASIESSPFPLLASVAKQRDSAHNRVYV